MEPRIQYAKTSDGVNVAYCTFGQGKAVLILSALPYCHIALSWRTEWTSWMERVVASGRRVVRFDPRGLGSSSRSVPAFSLDGFVSDMEAVVDALQLDEFDLWAPSTAAPIAITYAVRHPARVSHLALWAPVARYLDLARAPAYQSIWALRERDWDTYTQASTHIIFGWQNDEMANAQAKLLREAVTPDVAKQIWAAMDAFDVTDLLSSVRTPTLVELPADAQKTVFPPDLARAVAAGIPQAQLVAPGDLAAIVSQFFGTVETDDVPYATRSVALPTGLVTVLFTDLASSTALTQRLGDSKAQDLVRRHNAIVRQALAISGGNETKHTGDGIMASFSTASGALDCAIAIQRGTEANADPDLRVHIGLNAGEPVAEENDLFGTSVQLARRICDHAVAGQVLVSDVVRQLAAGKGFLFADIGEIALKGFEDPVRLYEVRWQADER